MQLSVIIPAYNAAATLPGLLASIKQALPDGHEVIVIDDNSTDGTGLCARQEGVRTITLARRCGPAAARNSGAREARGELLVFLDADTRVPRRFFTHVLDRFAAEPELQALVTYYSAEPLNTGFYPRYKALLVSYFFCGASEFESFEASCGAIRRRLFEQCGGFAESYRGAEVEDYEFGYRLLRHTRIVVDHDIRVGHAFPGFRKNAVNFYRRGALWMELFLSRRRLDSAGAAGREVLPRLAAVVSAGMLALAAIHPRGVLAGSMLLGVVYLLANRQWALFAARHAGVFFAAAAISVYWVESLIIAAGLARGTWRWLHRRLSGACCPEAAGER